jgi:hypothetical protein
MGMLLYREDAKHTKVFENLLLELRAFRASVVNNSLPNFATFASLREILPDQFDDRPIVL